MTRRTRLRFAAVLTVLFVVPFFSARAQAADMKAALKHVPADAFAVVGINLDKLRKSPAFKPALAVFKRETRSDRAMKKLKKATGFDAWRDIRSIVATFGPDFVKDDDEFALIIEAKFNKRKIVAFLKKKGKAKLAAGGKYWLLGRRGDAALAFRGSYILVGGAKAMKKLLASRRGKSKLLAKADKALLRKDAFVLADVPRKLRKELAQEHKDAGKLKTVAIGASLTFGLDLRAVAKFQTANAAGSLATLVRKMIQRAARERMARKSGLDVHIKRVKVASNGRKLTLTLKLTRAHVKQIVKQLEKALSKQSSSSPPPPPPPMAPPPPPTR